MKPDIRTFTKHHNSKQFIVTLNHLRESKRDKQAKIKC